MPGGRICDESVNLQWSVFIRVYFLPHLFRWVALQGDGKRRSGAHGARDRYLSPMLFDDLFRQRQSKSDASLLCRKVRLENLLDVFRQDAAAGIGKSDFEMRIRGLHRDAQFSSS